MEKHKAVRSLSRSPSHGSLREDLCAGMVKKGGKSPSPSPSPTFISNKKNQQADEDFDESCSDEDQGLAFKSLHDSCELAKDRRSKAQDVKYNEVLTPSPSANVHLAATAEAMSRFQKVVRSHFEGAKLVNPHTPSKIDDFLAEVQSTSPPQNAHCAATLEAISKYQKVVIAQFEESKIANPNTPTKLGDYFAEVVKFRSISETSNVNDEVETSDEDHSDEEDEDEDEDTAIVDKIGIQNEDFLYEDKAAIADSHHLISFHESEEVSSVKDDEGEEDEKVTSDDEEDEGIEGQEYESNGDKDDLEAVAIQAVQSPLDADVDLHSNVDVQETVSRVAQKFTGFGADNAHGLGDEFIEEDEGVFHVNCQARGNISIDDSTVLMGSRLPNGNHLTNNDTCLVQENTHGIKVVLSQTNTQKGSGCQYKPQVQNCAHHGGTFGHDEFKMGGSPCHDGQAMEGGADAGHVHMGLGKTVALSKAHGHAFVPRVDFAPSAAHVDSCTNGVEAALKSKLTAGGANNENISTATSFSHANAAHFEVISNTYRAGRPCEHLSKVAVGNSTFAADSLLTGGSYSTTRTDIECDEGKVGLPLVKHQHSGGPPIVDLCLALNSNPDSEGAKYAADLAKHAARNVINNSSACELKEDACESIKAAGFLVGALYSAGEDQLVAGPPIVSRLAASCSDVPITTILNDANCKHSLNNEVVGPKVVVDDLAKSRVAVIGSFPTAGKVPFAELFKTTQEQTHGPPDTVDICNNFKLEFVNHDVSKDCLVLPVPRELTVEGQNEWSTTLVGRFLGKKLPYSLVSNVTERLWGNFGLTDTLATDSGCYYFTFANEGFRDSVLEGGPWFIAGQPILLKPWKPNLSFAKEDIHVVPIWVNFYGIPLEYWNPKGISFISSFIGKPVQVDRTTASRRRITFARVCIEVSAKHDLINEFDIEAFDEETGKNVLTKINLEYQWTPIRCKECSKFGHDCSRVVKGSVDHTHSRKKEDGGVWQRVTKKDKGDQPIVDQFPTSVSRGIEGVNPQVSHPLDSVVDRIIIGSSWNSNVDSIVTKIDSSVSLPSSLVALKGKSSLSPGVITNNSFHSLPDEDEVGAAMDLVEANERLGIDTDSECDEDVEGFDELPARGLAELGCSSSSRQRKKASKKKLSGSRPKGRHKC